MESDNQVTKVAFLFGAGAEVDGGNKNTKNYGICSGYEYIRNSFPDGDTFDYMSEGLGLLFGKKCEKRFFGDTWKYGKSHLSLEKALCDRIARNLVFQKISFESDETKKNFLSKNKEIIEYILTNQDFFDLDLRKSVRKNNKRIEEWEHIDTCSDNAKILYSELCQVIQNGSYSDSSHLFIKELFSQNEVGNYNLNYSRGIAGVLDGYFYTIIAPAKNGPNNFAKIFNYYWACYFAILKDVLNYLREKEDKTATEYLCQRQNTEAGKNAKMELDYQAILKNLQDLTTHLYECIDLKTLRQKDSYYDLISNELNKKTTELTCVGVATTNYYRFCEVVHGAPIYLNGSLNLFEFPETLEVKDGGKKRDKTTDLSGEKLFFPFIFGQSMVKPIVHSKQTEEFHRFKEMLKEASVLVVLGYGINEDDNHINAFLHEFLKKDGKRLICVNKTGEVDSIIKKLRFTEEGSGKDNVKDRIAAVSFSGDNNKTVKEIFKLIRSKKTSQEKFDIAVAASNIANGKGELT